MQAQIVQWPIEWWQKHYLQAFNQVHASAVPSMYLNYHRLMGRNYGIVIQPCKVVHSIRYLVAKRCSGEYVAVADEVGRLTSLKIPVKNVLCRDTSLH